jgi:hypothetical protein
MIETTNDLMDPIEQIESKTLDELRRDQMHDVRRVELRRAIIRQKEAQERREARLREHGLIVVSDA